MGRLLVAVTPFSYFDFPSILFSGIPPKPGFLPVIWLFRPFTLCLKPDLLVFLACIS